MPRKSFVIGSCVIVGVATCFTLRYYWKRKSRKYYSSVEETSSDGGKRILVLGLDDAGKSSLLLHLSRPDAASTRPPPTEGFNVVCINSENGSSLNFWELGGSETVRPYWPNFLHDTGVLVYMVNSADTQRLRPAAHEFRRILQDERLRHVPILVLANKQVCFSNGLQDASVNPLLSATMLTPEHCRGGIDLSTNRLTVQGNHGSYPTPAGMRWFDSPYLKSDELPTCKSKRPCPTGPFLEQVSCCAARVHALYRQPWSLTLLHDHCLGRCMKYY
ncbi:hypothetical protein HPB48_014135 [Haemaphysalis longicornis]|uniref:ADP-ribosylation factor-like protein 3 n=1 Tax=Haemaphysalis longicornis TaxID=44386 RepID=A0A9J6FJE5_HAELO|nr:hypothetical protein HPB48_014135 [Haemaphysalis longicornis]